MSKSMVSKFFTNTAVPFTMGLAGFLLLLTGIASGNEAIVVVGGILLASGGGWLFTILRTRIYRLPCFL